MNEIDSSNKESVRRPASTIDPKYPVAKGKGLRIVTSNSPTIAAKIKPKKAGKAIYKRD
jgi:hypothetical protein